ncbi:catechol 2,3-dioxygenase-like lactoylglutathione lyase family enzyme [Paraburkholderia sp. WSM4175]|uniref:VOC family protein n=1 Tax=Paraburkholderia sp. WSM4175 TaxID=2991072 RepID=UPI003D25CA52
MQTSTLASRRSASELGLRPNMLNHYARVTHDVGATADFYGRILGMELASTIMDDHVPSTGDAFPYFHIFFRMADGSTMAFFECTNLPLPSSPSHPAYDVFDHIALEVSDTAELMRWKEWLVSQGVDVLGPVDHKGIIQSIYFRDPNGYRLELTTPIDPAWNQHTTQAQEDLNHWLAAKAAAQAEGRDVSAAMIELIGQIKRKRYETSAEGNN